LASTDALFLYKPVNPSRAAAKKDSLFRNFGPENPKNMVINNQS
jgi:hypothetical protein